MHGTHVRTKDIEMTTITPETAMALLELNKLNRPIDQANIKRIAKAIAEDRWKYNGDTIKISDDDSVLDGQHRLWACIEARKPIQTIIVRGIARDAFATIDTMRKLRNASDIVALNGTLRHRQAIGTALQWLVRYHRNCLPEYKTADNRVENDDVERAFVENPGIASAIDRAATVKRVANYGLIGFLYYVVANRNATLAERLIATFDNPSRVSVTDPLYLLRAYFHSDGRKDPVVTMAVCFKALNAAGENKTMKTLSWKNQGKTAEEFPKLTIPPEQKTVR